MSNTTTTSAEPLRSPAPHHALYPLEVHGGRRCAIPPVDEIEAAVGCWNQLLPPVRATLDLAQRCATQADLDTKARALLAPKRVPSAAPLVLILAPSEEVSILRYVGRGHYPGNVAGRCVDIDGQTWHREGDACDDCGWGYPNDPDRDNLRLARVVITGRTIPRPWLDRILAQCAAAGVPVEQDPETVVVLTPPAPPSPTSVLPPPRRPEDVCCDPDCDLSDGLAHGGPCAPCACWERHAIEECPKNPDARYPRCVSCGAWEGEAATMRFVRSRGRNLHIGCAT